MTKTSTIIILAGLVVLAGFLAIRSFRGDEFNLPVGGETKKEMIVIEGGDVRDEAEDRDNNKPDRKDDGKKDTKKNKVPQKAAPPKTKEIMVTGGVRHSVPLGEIRTLLPKDRIPSIDNPKFVSPSEADAWLDDKEPGVALTVGNVSRFYPYQILVWHELINDTIDGQRVLITYCPLCLTGYVFDPVVQGERVLFGTSGKLWRSNLVMYDRKTESLWSQILGEAIAGEATGAELKVLRSDQVRYGNWKSKYPAGEVLSRDTGAARFYGSYPYRGDYFTVDDLAISLVSPKDTRLPNEAFIFGIEVNGKAKAYSVLSVKEKGEVVDNFQGETFILRHDQGLDVVRMFKKLPGGKEERINPFSAFWFSWASAHPETELYK